MSSENFKAIAKMLEALLDRVEVLERKVSRLEGSMDAIIPRKGR